MKRILFLFFIFISFHISIFALSEEECISILTKTLSKYEKVILNKEEEFTIEDFKFSKINDEYIEVSFKIKAEELKVISSNSKGSFQKEVEKVFDNSLARLAEIEGTYIYQHYKNIIAAKGNIRRGDVLFLKSVNGSRLSFIAQSPVKENSENIFQLKPLYNGHIHTFAKLERKSYPLFLDVNYSLGFINTFRNFINLDLKTSLLYPLFIKAGLCADLELSFEGGFVGTTLGANIGFECQIPFDYIFSSLTSLNLYTDFNLFFGKASYDDYFYCVPDVGVGLLWYVKDNLALRMGAKFMTIITFYTFFLPTVNLGASIIL